ncbi:MAG TPA: tRNA (adenosine(37)-N6)-threonylcarbamoyltransferase complex ATPase subunit type 1 TsaE [Saprospirales bacterium]|nr:tRNA (adenosine(37)-N6)-threonylcarbamoyltransferase complex ATPase subunit type 1 TsaE [Saprospirales bacterium]
MDWLLHSPDDLPAIMPEIISALGARRKIALYGEMGAGKTTFVKALSAHLGVKDNTSSPTFSLINEYHYIAPDGSSALLHHLDLYRLKNANEAFDIGLDDLMHDPWFCIVEWPQIAEGFFPENSASIHIEILGETQRRIVLS